MRQYDVLIVGAGQAGAQTAITLIQRGFSGTIALIGDEIDPPYERPPLSKAYLAGDLLAARMMLRPVAFWAESGVELIMQERVVSVDWTTRQIACASGLALGYGRLVWATGGYPRRLSCSGAGLDRVHVVRTRPQVDGLRRDLIDSERVVIVGGGYIGLETAAILAKAGKSVTLLESQNRLLSRVTSPELSEFILAEHAKNGVHIQTSTSIAAILGTDGVRAVALEDGTEIPADVVIVGVGLIPEITALAEAGATCENGVDVDGYCQTSLPNVLAAGDCANHPNPFANGRRVRLESVQNAIDQAKIVASAILGESTPYNSVPWFWSNQYDLKLQTAGLCMDYDEVVFRGTANTRSFSLIYLRDQQIIAIDCVNAPRDFVQGRSLVAQGVRVSAAASLSNMDRDLRELNHSAAQFHDNS